MENHDFKSPISIIFGVITFISGLLDIETWALLIGIICTVITTITAFRRNRSQERYFDTKQRKLDQEVDEWLRKKN